MKAFLAPRAPHRILGLTCSVILLSVASVSAPCGAQAADFLPDTRPIPESEVPFQKRIDYTFRADGGPGCLPRTLELGLAQASSPAAERDFLQGWFDRCTSSFKPWVPTKSFDLLYEYARTTTPFRKWGWLERTRIRLEGGRELDGLFAWQPTEEPRPLVLLRSGIFGDIGENPNTQDILLHLGQEAGVHVLILASHSGRAFTREAGDLFLSGVDEAMSTVDIIRTLRASIELSARISEIHLVGYSFGAHGTLLTSALLSSAGLASATRLPVRSTLAFCPVTDLNLTLKAAGAGGGATDLLNEWFNDFIKDVGSFLPRLGRSLGPKPWPASRAADILLENTRLALSEQWARTPPIMDLPNASELMSLPISPAAFAEMHDFRTWESWNRIPTLVVANAHDSLVPQSLNAFSLRQTPVVSFGLGDHCANATAMGRPNFGALLRGHLYAHSDYRPPSPPGNRVRIRNSPDRKPKGVWKWTRWIAAENSSGLELRLGSDRGETRVWVSPFELTSLGIPERFPNEAEQADLLRYLNSFVDVQTEFGESVVGTDWDSAPYLVARRAYSRSLE